MSAGQPWTHKNQGQKIMFGGTEAVITYRRSTPNLTEPAIARCKKQGVLTDLVDGGIFNHATEWVIASDGNPIRKNANQVQPGVTVILHGKKAYYVPETHTALTLLDANVKSGRLWLICRIQERYSLYTGLVGSTLVEVFSEPINSYGNSNVAYPVIFSDCSVARVGFHNASPGVLTYKDIALADDGSIGAIATSVWDGGLTDAPRTMVPRPPTSFDFAGNPTQVIRLYNVRILNHVYSEGARVHPSAFNPEYWECTTGGTSSNNANLSFPAGGPGPVNDGSVVWSYGGAADPNLQPTQWVQVDTAYASSEHTIVGEDPFAGEKTLETYIQETITRVLADNTEQRYNTLISSPPPPQFATQYPVNYYPGNSFPSAFDRSVTLTFEAFLAGVSTGTFDVVLNTRRALWNVTTGGFGGSGGGMPEQIPTGSGEYSGVKPLGWVRNIETGAIESVHVQDESTTVYSGGFTGSLGGMGGSIASANGYHLMYSSGVAAAAALPTPSGYSCSYTSSVSGYVQEGLYIGGVLQCIFNNVGATVEGTSSRSTSRSITAGPPPPAPPGGYATYSNYVLGNLVTTSDSGGSRSRVDHLKILNLQAKLFYVYTLEQDNLIPETNPPASGYPVSGSRKIYHNGALIFTDTNVGATNAYGGLPSLQNRASGFTGAAPFGNKSNLGFLIGVHDVHNHASFWFEGTNPVASQNQWLLDHTGHIFLEVPNGDFPIEVSSIQNFGSDIWSLYLNINQA